MGKYHVSFMCIYSDEVEADSPEEAADLVESWCPYDIDGSAWVTNKDTGEESEV